MAYMDSLWRISAKMINALYAYTAYDMACQLMFIAFGAFAFRHIANFNLGRWHNVHHQHFEARIKHFDWWIVPLAVGDVGGSFQKTAMGCDNGASIGLHKVANHGIWPIGGWEPANDRLATCLLGQNCLNHHKTFDCARRLFDIFASRQKNTKRQRRTLEKRGLLYSCYQAGFSKRPHGIGRWEILAFALCRKRVHFEPTTLDLERFSDNFPTQNENENCLSTVYQQDA